MSARYEIHAIADERMTHVHPDVLAETDDAAEAKRLAARHSGSLYGAAIVDTATRSVDYGSESIACTISERGNGLPDVGDYVGGDDGELYEIVSMGSTIHTGRAGEGNYVFARVELADWADVEEDEVHTAAATLDSEAEVSS